MEFGVLMLISIIVLCVFLTCACFLACSHKALLSGDDEGGIWQFSIFIGIIVFIIAICFFIWWGNSFAHDGRESVIMGLILRIIPIILGGIALNIAFLNFHRKTNNNIHYQLNNVPATAIADKDGGLKELSNNYPNYISSVMLRNSKDKKVAIMGMYLEVSKRSIICIADYSDKPEIIDAYSTINLEILPVTLYAHIPSFEENRMIRRLISGVEFELGEKIHKRAFVTNQQQISDLVANEAKLILETADGIHYPTPLKSYLKELDKYQHKFISYQKKYKTEVLPNLTYAICTINLDHIKFLYMLVFLKKIDENRAKISEIRLLNDGFKIEDYIYIPKDMYDTVFDVGQSSNIDKEKLLNILDEIVNDRVCLSYEDAKLDRESLDFNISYLGQSSIAKRGIFYKQCLYRKIKDI